MSENHRRLHVRKERLDTEAQILGTVVRGLSGSQGDVVEYVSVKGHHPFSSEATILLKADTRERAVAYLGMFPPSGLDMAELRDGSQVLITTVTRMPGQVIRKRETIVPFLYSVVQTRKVVRHTLTWVHVLPGGIQVTMECDIKEDRAAFVFEHLDDQAHNQVLFRRVPNGWVPEGRRRDSRGMEWSTVKDVPASLTVWWPWKHTKIVEAGQAQGQDWLGSIEELAFVLLEVRQEAQAWANDYQ